jgi:hypothetical protein
MKMDKRTIEWNDEICEIVDTPKVKHVRSKRYNFDFSKVNGLFLRWGETIDDDPIISPFGPEIADIEISVNGCPNRCSFCSPAGTIVNTPNGDKQIQDLKVGDRVWGYKNGEKVEQEIVETYSRQYEGEMIYIELDNGQTVALTPEHPVVLADGRQILAGDLNGDEEIICLG